MKFTLNTLVVAAALASASIAHATPVTINAGASMIINDPAGSGRQGRLSFVNGSGDLSFSKGSNFDALDANTIGGLIGALNVGNVGLSGVGGATVREQHIVDIFGDDVRIGATATAPVASVTADNLTGQVLSVASAGGTLQSATRITGTLTGGTASVTNLRFDLVNKVVYADLAGTKAGIGTSAPVDYNLPNTALWTIGSISGPTVIPPAALLSSNPAGALQAAGFTDLGNNRFSATNVISGLKVTQAGFDFFKDSLGLLSTGANALNAVNEDPQGWGSVTSTLVFSANIPEPSTYALFGIGLLMMGAAVRGHRRVPA